MLTLIWSCNLDAMAKFGNEPILLNGNFYMIKSKVAEWFEMMKFCDSIGELVNL